MATPTSQSNIPAVELVDRYIDEPRPLRVAVIGGGLTGINAGILLPAKVPTIDLTIYEKNKELGGTWLENSYPGVRCDIPSHAYQSTFEPKLDWSDVFSFGAEIRDYWQGVARKHGVYKYVRLGHRVETAEWDDVKGEWRVVVHDIDANETIEATFDVVITAVGRFNNWRLPKYPGIDEFGGVLRHAQNWDPSIDLAGKRVAVIGNGASGIQLVANLQKVVSRLDHYARNRTWITPSWAGDVREAGPQPYSEEQKALFLRDPSAYLEFRRELEARYWRRFGTFFKNGQASEDVRKQFTELMLARVAKKPSLREDLIPDFAPNCRRPTPGPGYLEALAEDNVDYVRKPIRRFTATGIETVDGVQRDVDIIICATGAVPTMVPSFQIRAHGHTLADVWGPPGKGHPYTYMGVATPGFPNLFYVQGPHGAGATGTVPHSAETQITFLAQILRKLAREGVRTITPSVAAADEFEAFAQSFFARTNLSDNCSSWYNGFNPGGYIHGLWPGSAGHVTTVRRVPRWEDWEYTYLTDEAGKPSNRFAWYLGNGWTRRELDPELDVVPYLHLPGEVAVKDLHESWWNTP